MAATSIRQRRLWARSRSVALWLLLTWLLVSVAVPWFARDLHGVQGFGFPLGFWLAAQGALLAYLVIIVVDVVVMERLEARDRRDAVGEAAAEAAVAIDADHGADVVDADVDVRPAASIRGGR